MRATIMYRAGDDVFQKHHHQQRPAPVRAYIADLLPDVLEDRIQPGRVFDSVIGLDQVPEGYKAMDKREAIKVMIKP